MKQKKEIKHKSQANSKQAAATSVKQLQTKLLLPLILLLLIFILYTFNFYRIGKSGFEVTLLFYGILLLSVFTFLSGKVIRINAIALVGILFGMECYLKFSDSHLSIYTERNSPSLFGNYYSNFYGKTRNHEGLFINKPDYKTRYQTREYNYPMEYNELGLREKSISQFSNSRNIIIVGDSYTECIGAPYDSTISAALQYHLNQSGYPLKVINGGVSGSDLFFSFELLKRLKSGINPEVVILNLNSSDINDVIIRGGNERFGKNNKFHFRKQKWWEYIYSFSYLFRYVTNTILQKGPFEYDDTDIPYALGQINAKIDEYIRYCKSINAKFVLVISPTPKELYKNVFYLYDIKQAIDAKSDVQVIYMHSFMAEALQRNNVPLEYYYYPLDLHMKPIGNWLWGETVAAVLTERGIIQQQP
jgi:hypothetical protein